MVNVMLQRKLARWSAQIARVVSFYFYSSICNFLKFMHICIYFVLWPRYIFSITCRLRALQIYYYSQQGTISFFMFTILYGRHHSLKVSLVFTFFLLIVFLNNAIKLYFSMAMPMVF